MSIFNNKNISDNTILHYQSKQLPLTTVKLFPVFVCLLVHLVGSAVVKVEGVQHLELLVLIVAHWVDWVFGLGEIYIMTLQGQPGTTHG